MGRNVSIGTKLSHYEQFLLKQIDDTYPPYLSNIRARILKEVWRRLDESKAPYPWKMVSYYWQEWVWYSSFALWGSLHTLEDRKCLKTYLEMPQQASERLALEKAKLAPSAGRDRPLYYEVIGLR